jgi:hypothetical protein
MITLLRVRYSPVAGPANALRCAPAYAPFSFGHALALLAHHCIQALSDHVRLPIVNTDIHQFSEQVVFKSVIALAPLR